MCQYLFERIEKSANIAIAVGVVAVWRSVVGRFLKFQVAGAAGTTGLAPAFDHLLEQVWGFDYTGDNVGDFNCPALQADLTKCAYLLCNIGHQI